MDRSHHTDMLVPTTCGADRSPGPVDNKSCCLPTRGADARASTHTTIKRGRAKLTLTSLPGGWFEMGASDAPYQEDGEAPTRQVKVDPFSISPTAVKNAEFAAFVATTGYQTLAERMGSSFVFHAFIKDGRQHPAPAHTPWWRAVDGAHWAAPFGPGSTIEGLEDHPVVHIAHPDALNFCQWSGTRLPSEAEWEYAARGGLEGQAYPWGNELEPEGEHRCNIWQGEFPNNNTCEDGYVGTAPVNAYPANGFGLYNMTGNVWEWIADRFTRLHSPRPAKNPTGSLSDPHFIAKGGSYLCHRSYCARYRTSSRQALMPDTSTGNLGFRVAGMRTRRVP